MRLVDTHCHINFDSYDDDREAVFARAAAVGVRQIINPAIDLQTSREIVGLTAQYEGLYAAVGIHPNSSADFADSIVDDLATLAKQSKVVAIGEIGLDYHWDKSPKAQQFRAFEAQLALAARLELPVIIHNREASEDVISIVEHWAGDLPTSLKNRPGVLHSFSAPAAIAERALASGFYLGFTGPITYKNADSLRHIAARVPLNRLLVETDGPFLTPVPHRGKRNEPAYIPFMVERLASLQQVSVEQMGTATTENAVRLFSLPVLNG
jgi:TatD DNase family protein